MVQDYGARMLDMLEQALLSEEKQLQEFRERNICGPDYPDIKSVRMFDEGWIQYLVAKQALRDAKPPRVETEVEGHLDFLLLARNGGDKLAAFELKGPFYVGKNQPGMEYSRKIAGDFRKLSKAESLGATPKYVILLPYGHEPDVKTWLQNTLAPSVSDFLNTSGVAHALSRWIHLNQIDDRGTDMLIILLEVAARCAS